MKYFCIVCHNEIVGEEIDERHSFAGEDCHVDCCPGCAADYERQDTEEDIAAGEEYARQQAKEREAP